MNLAKLRQEIKDQKLKMLDAKHQNEQSDVTQPSSPFRAAPRLTRLRAITRDSHILSGLQLTLRIQVKCSLKLLRYGSSLDIAWVMALLLKTPA